jgi:hypothetical protein
VIPLLENVDMFTQQEGANSLRISWDGELDEKFQGQPIQSPPCDFPGQPGLVIELKGS